MGTNSPSSDIHIRRSGQSVLQITSDTAEAIISVGRSTTLIGSNGALIFGNTSGLYPYSNSKTLDIVNYDTGSLNHYLHYGISGVGTGNFNWLYGQSPTNPLMTLTYSGNLGIGITNPTVKLEVSGIASVTSLVTEDITATGNITATEEGTSTSVRTLYVYGGKSKILNADGTQIFENSNVNLTSGISTFFKINVTNNSTFNEITAGVSSFSSINSEFGLFTESVGIGTTVDPINIENQNTRFYVVGNSEFYGGVGIGTTNPTSALTVVGDVSVSGVTTSIGGFTSGIGVTNPVKIAVSGNVLSFTVAGVGSTSLILY